MDSEPKATEANEAIIIVAGTEPKASGLGLEVGQSQSFESIRDAWENDLA